MQLLLDADVVISDCSSIIYEAWSLGKPVVFPDWIVRDAIMQRFRGSFEWLVYQKGIGLHASCLDELVEMLDGEMGSVEKDFIEGVFPAELRGKSGLRAAEVLREIE